MSDTVSPAPRPSVVPVIDAPCDPTLDGPEVPAPAAALPAPIIKYVGGKGDLASRIVDLFPEQVKAYIEPFFGGGAVFFEAYRAGVLKSAEITIADGDANLMDLYEAIQTDPVDLSKRLEILRGAYTKDAEDLYYKVRDLWNRRHYSPAKNIFLRYASFNGLWRVNKQGRMNAPWGKYKQVALPSLARLQAVSAALQNVSIERGHFREVLYFSDDVQEPGTVVYLDPPYDAGFVGYTAGGFSTTDQEELIVAAAEWAVTGATVIYSNADTPLINEMLADRWPSACIEKVPVKRRINSDGAKRGPVTELLVSQNARKPTDDGIDRSALV